MIWSPGVLPYIKYSKLPDNTRQWGLGNVGVYEKRVVSWELWLAETGADSLTQTSGWSRIYVFGLSPFFDVLVRLQHHVLFC